MVADQRYAITGVLDPDITGNYEPIGPWNGKPSYELAGNGWFLYWSTASTAWHIADSLGNGVPPSWFRADPNIEGVYTPILPATGDATVSEIV